MKQCYYISITDLEDISQGVTKKINSQIDIFSEYWICNSIYAKHSEVILKKQKKYIYPIKNRIQKRLKLMSVLYENIKKDNEHSIQTDFIYIRYFKSDFCFLYFLKKIKNISNSKIIIEIPTYPYDQEIKGGLLSKLDKLFRNFLYRYVDYIVTFSNDKKIFKVPCINISNGINLLENKIVDKKIKSKNLIEFTSVSTVMSHHGIDRFLYSIEHYLEQYKSTDSNLKIKFNIIGEGSETVKLKEIVARSSYLKEVVIFHGFKSGKELDDIYNRTDIAVGSLGIHRIGLKEVQPLKNREYTAKGLPFIISFKDPDFENQHFVFKVTNDESLIDIKSLIDWYYSNEFLPRDINKYAEKFSWDKQMKKVIEYLE